tara:strand:+ start:1773 stop:2609 length:837 start_codon:yes stop_codon:yes gene_type:complete
MSSKGKILERKRSKSRLRTKLSEFQYFKNLLEEIEELFEDYSVELNEVVDDITNLVINKVNKTSNEETLPVIIKGDELSTGNVNFDNADNSEKSLKEVLPEPPAWMKKLFKAIAIKTHPDKIDNREDLSEIEKAELTNYYKQASSAMDLNDEMALLEIAVLLEIDPLITDKEQAQIISKEIDDIKKEIKRIQNLVAWLWGENFGNIEVRTNLLIYLRDQLKLPKVDGDLILKYITAFEAGEDLSQFKQHSERQKSNRAKIRKIGERPAPSIASLRTEK